MAVDYGTGTPDDYATPWLQGNDIPGADGSGGFFGASPTTMARDSANPLIGGVPTDAAPVSSPGGGYFNEAAPTTAGSPWLADAPSGNVGGSGASAPGAAAPASVAQSEIDKHQMAQNLEADGHKVTWNTQGQMVVDGRAYDVPGDTPAPATGDAPAPATPPAAAAAVLYPGDPGTTYGSDSQWHGPDGSVLPNQGRNPNAGAPSAIVPPSGNDPINGQANVTQAPPAGPGAPPPDPTAPLDMSVPDWLKNMVPGYTPTPMDTSLSELPDFQTLFASASGRNPNQQALDTLVSQVLAHPESLSERDIQTLKGKAAEEAAVAAQANDEDLLHFGANSNLTDSPWLASARQANAQSRRNTTIQSNQSLDIAAADRRTADQRGAAALGITAQNATSARSQAATSVALSGVLAKVNAQTTRAQMNESFKQAATELGLSTAGLATNYVLGHAGIQIDERKLKQQSDQWKQDLALKIAQLKQQSDQFDADLQLETQKFQHSKENDAWAQAQAAYAA